jgi:kanamycin nucleotidyltransferase
MDRAERIRVAKELSEGFLGRFGDQIVATGLRGSVAREEDNEHSDVDMVVITEDAGIVGSRSLLLGPIAVEVLATSRAEYLHEATVIGPWWPMLADQFIHSRPLHDPNNFYGELRRHYDAAMNAASDEVFVRAESQDIVQAVTWAYKARASTGSNETIARLAIAESALRAVMSIGLRARFVFKNSAHAFRIIGQLPGAPPRFGKAMETALTSGTDVVEAVGAIEEAIEALLEAAIANGVPITGESADDFL